MLPEVYAPRPVRPPTPSLANIDPECPPASKRPRLSPLPLPSPAPSIDHYHFHLQRPSSCPDGAESPTKPSASRKRGLEGFDHDCTPANKRRRLSPASLSTTVLEWVFQVSRYSNYSTSFPQARPRSAPPDFSSRRQLRPLEHDALQPASLAGLNQMSRSDVLRLSSVASSQSGRRSTSSPLYRSLIRNNNVILDPSGRRMPREIKDLLDVHILKGRDSPPLTDAEVFEVVDTAEDLLDSAESRATDLIGTKAFPVKRLGIAEGRNVQWTIDPLPTNSDYPHPLSAPKPDCHYGYPLGHKSNWTRAEMAVVDHRTAQPYTQPTRENLFPFYMLEIKAEPTGGVLYVAENQAVGSGVHSVESLRWLLSEAFPSEVPKATDAVAFTAAVTPRIAVFYICWFSEQDQCHFMSMFKIVSFMNGPPKPDIQECRNINKSIIDYGNTLRQATIRNALGRLNPIPPHWKKSRPATTVTEGPPTSVGVDETESSKSRRR
ncbi:MAG: hypothetical protein M1817_001378 [Caeruleum heppii]|nr:MAG: hypothetical protein M1817_001378 [Caeruleum heppii]